LTTTSCGSGEVSGRLASLGVLVVFNWRGETMESTVARLLDKVALLGDVGGYVCFTVMATAALGRRRAWRGSEKEKLWRGGVDAGGS
jgi:hypothetical protein